MKSVSTSVGQLSEFCRGGDINFRFRVKSSSLEGIRGHQTVQKSRGEFYLAEHPISLSLNTLDMEIEVSGRIDGCWYDALRELFCIEEIKTVRVEVEDIPAGILDKYWHQAELYGYIVGRQVRATHIMVRLCFYHLNKKSETVLEKVIDISSLTATFVDTVAFFTSILDQRQKWIASRNSSMGDLDFPYGEFRLGQRDLAISVYRAIANNRQLVVQAPTGIGKTMATLYPSIKAMAHGAADRLFYLSARNSTQELAQIALKDITSSGGKVRSIVITSKEKICFTPGKPCHPDHCEYARGYYDLRQKTVQEMLGSDNHFDKTSIEIAARRHGVCPYELSLDLSRSCDVIIADYNYVFDPSVYLRRYLGAGIKNSSALIDEAHNLVERGREMFSAEVSKESYLEIAQLYKKTAPALAKAAKSIDTEIVDLKKQFTQQFETHGYVTSDQAPDSVVSLMQKFCDHAEVELRADGFGRVRDKLLSLYFKTVRFIRTEDSFGADYALILQRKAEKHLLKLFCKDPSSQLDKSFGRLASAVCFSATMQPAVYFRRMLGFPQTADWYKIPTPFDANNLRVSIAGFVDTSYKGRSESLFELVKLIYAVINAKEGNYLVFFPSYAYLKSAVKEFRVKYPEIKILAQQRNALDEDRAKFLEAFKEKDTICGFAVMGGGFSEGIDLKGERLIGSIVVGVGLPQIELERNLVSQHFGEIGFEYAYQYPGLVKVLQTGGRVIRGESDRGIICLIDNRYLSRKYLDLLPVEWSPVTCKSRSEVVANFNSFWRK